jgi:bifunctional lysine-specific demethylase and histidyl-hydroxylase NO66
VKDGRPLPPTRYLRHARVGSRPISDLADPARIMDEFEGGATIVLQGLQRYWPPLTAFCRALEHTLSHPVQANAYLTPPTSSGLRVHEDAHDVFALQTHGRKQWIVYWEAGADSPRDLTLQPGDSLYLPRGTRHAARTVDEPSLHITIGVRTTRWRDVAAGALAQVGEHGALDEALPLGYAHDRHAFAEAVAAKLAELARAIDKLDAAALSDRLVDDVHLSRPPLLAGQLRDLLDLDRVADDTLLGRRPGSVCVVRRRGERVELLLGDRRVSFPARVAPAVEAVSTADVLRPADLATYLDEPGRLVLVRRLVREGLLTQVRDGVPR